MSERETYQLHVVFRGLFLVDPQEDGVYVYLPDARSPGISPSRSEPYREHTPLIEFHQEDWRNPSLEMPQVIHVAKPNKKPVAMCFLHGEQIFIRGARFSFSSPEIPEADRARFNQRYSQVPDGVWILEDDDLHGVRQLHGFGPEIVEGGERKRAASVCFEQGVFKSERRSLGKDGKELLWTRVSGSAAQNETQASEEEPRPINLDLRVTLPVDRSDAVEITLSSGTQFLLRPADERDLTVWIKNRELETILEDSDLLPDPFISGCELLGRLDLDHEILYGLAYSDLSSHLQDIRIPVSDDVETSGGGCACGGACRP